MDKYIYRKRAQRLAATVPLRAVACVGGCSADFLVFVFSDPCSWAPVEVNGLSASHVHTMPQASAKGSKGAACAEDSGRAYPLCLRGLQADRVCGLQAGEEPGSL